MQHTGGHGSARPVPARGARRRLGGGGIARGSDNADQQHLLEFVRTRRGVEGFVEPRTTVTDVTLLLVAHDGEWTRRRVPSVHWAHEFANRNGVPSLRRGAGRHPRPDARVQPREKERQKQQLDRDLDGPSRLAGHSDWPGVRPARRPAARGVRHQRGDAVPGRAGRHVAPRPARVPGRAGDVEVGPRPAADELARGTPRRTARSPTAPSCAAARRRSCSRCGPPRGSRRGSAAATAARRSPRPRHVSAAVVSSSPNSPATFSPRATMHGPVRVATSTTGVVLAPRPPSPARRPGSAGPRRRCW